MTQKRNPPNRNPRVNVTLTPEAMKVVAELADLLDQPRSALVAELVDAALPALVSTIEAVRIAKEQPREAQRLISNYAAKSVMELSQAQLNLDEVIDRRTVKGKRHKKGATDGTP